jgi:hypothetical protein
MTLQQFISDYNIPDGDTYEQVEMIIIDFNEQVTGDYDMHDLVDWIACEVDCDKSLVYEIYDNY